MPSPNPHWKPGDKVTPPTIDTIEFDLSAMPILERYRLIIGSVVPRPIAFVSTMNKQGQVNLAPFSFFMGVSSNPPCLAFSVSRKPSGEKKDTLRNIEETGDFVINTASEWLIEPLVHTAADFPYGVDEMAKVGLTPIASKMVKPPRVREAAVQFECALHHLLQIGDGTAGSAELIVGKILYLHVQKTAYQNGRILLSETKPVSRLGGTSYAKLGELFDIPIPKA